MALVTDLPDDIPTTDVLRDLENPDAVEEVPPAFLTLGTTPAPIYNPPELDDTLTYMVRVRCTGKHGPLKRADGEVRFKRDLQIQAIWLPGQPEPKSQDELDAEAKAEAEKNQPALFASEDEFYGRDEDSNEDGVDE